MRQEQGCMVDCVLCTIIKPKREEGEECPVCHGQIHYFQPARMMDKSTSERELIHNLVWMDRDVLKDEEGLKRVLRGILQDIEIYNFNFREAIINYLKYLYHVDY